MNYSQLVVSRQELTLRKTDGKKHAALFVVVDGNATSFFFRNILMSFVGTDICSGMDKRVFHSDATAQLRPRVGR